MNQPHHLLIIQLACDIISKFGKDPGVIFTDELTPYQAISDIYPSFHTLSFDKRMNVVIKVMDYMLNCTMVDYVPRIQQIAHDYYYCWYDNDDPDHPKRGVIIDAKSNHPCYIFDVHELINAGIMTNEYDVLRLKGFLVDKLLLEKDQSLIMIKA